MMLTHQYQSVFEKDRRQFHHKRDPTPLKYIVNIDPLAYYNCEVLGNQLQRPGDTIEQA